jgi:hypothetical protein
MVVVRFILGLALAAFGSGCRLCDNTFVADYPSPDGTHQVIVFERGCGATTGTSTQVSLIPAIPERGVTPLGTGNVWIADDPAESVDLKVRWIDAKHVELSHRKTRVTNLVSEVEGVVIKYVEQP